MKKISLVISDVDGTLVTTDKALLPGTVRAVRRLHEHGIGFSICSSRPPFGMRMMIDPLQLKLPFGGYNSGAIVTTDFTVLEQKVIPPETAKQAVEVFHAHGVDCWVFVGNEWVITNRQGDHVDHEIHTIHTPPTVVSDFRDEHFRAVGKIVGASNDHDRVARVEHIMREALDGRANAMRSQPYYCDVIAPGINKGRIVEVLSERLGVPREEIAVLGDMENDLEMFAKAGFSIAMGNASPEVKRAADVVTLSNEEEGWEQAIERHILAG
ncbi:MAG TPA: Cof-type HAD-IIB family hydrolase [Stellaceae bacterium]|nr:Cof-type HAD-IIB family hydrolase [Stellaceae bacterium]